MTSNPYAPPAHIQPDLHEARALLKSCVDISAALDKLDADLEAARAAQAEAQGRRADLLAARALEVDPSKVKAYAAKLDKAATEALKAAGEFEAVEIAQKALQAHLQDAEEELRSFVDFRGAQLTAAHASQVAEQLMGELAEAIRGLLPVLVKAAALQDATHSQQLAFMLAELHIPSGGPTGAPLLTGSLADLPGERVMVRSAWKEMAELVELHHVAGETKRTMQQVRDYVPRARRMKAAAPYVRRGYTMDGERTTEARASKAPAPAAATAHQAATAAQATTDRHRDPLREKPTRTGSSLRPAEIVDGNVAAGMLNNLMRD